MRRAAGVAAMLAVACAAPHEVRTGAGSGAGAGGAETSESGSGAGSDSGSVAGTGAGAGAGVAKPALADWPRVDLAANHVRFQLHDAGLVIPVAGEGLALYDLEYKSPWGDVVTVDGRRGRRVRGKAAVLTAPWPGGAGTVVVRAHDGGDTKLAIDGKAIGTLALGGGWGRAAIAVDLAAGDHRFTLTPGRGAAIASVELVAGAGATPCAADPLPASALVGAGTLGGWRELRVPVEVPRAATLIVTPAGGGAAAIEVHADGAAPATAWRGDADGREHAIELAPHADRVVELRFTGGCATRWTGAAIAVAARDVAPAPAPVKNAILVVIDSLRADRVAPMGPTRVATPRLAQLAARGVAFQRHQSMAPSSPPSHASIHTGQIPRVHGVAGDDPPLAEGAPVLARIARDAGLWTGYIGNNDFAMGRLRTRAGWHAASTPALDGRGNECDIVMKGVLAMAEAARAKGDRYFIAALPIQPHAPYRYHPGVTEKYFAGPFPAPLGKRVTSATMARVKARGLTAAQWEQYRGLYDGEVEQVDACVGILVDGLAALGADADTAIVVTSDHGEGMGERGKNVGHAYGLYRELLEVPLIVAAPGLGPATVDTVTSAADVAPTVLELLGLPPDPRIQGASLVPLARFGAGAPRRIAASEYGRSYAVRAGAWRYVVGYDGAGVLYDTIRDPAETRDAGADAPIVLRYLRGAAGLYLAHRTAWRAATWGTLGDLAPTSPLAAPPP